MSQVRFQEYGELHLAVIDSLRRVAGPDQRTQKRKSPFVVFLGSSAVDTAGTGSISGTRP